MVTMNKTKNKSKNNAQDKSKGNSEDGKLYKFYQTKGWCKYSYAKRNGKTVPINKGTHFCLMGACLLIGDNSLTERLNKIVNKLNFKIPAMFNDSLKSKAQMMKFVKENNL